VAGGGTAGGVGGGGAATGGGGAGPACPPLPISSLPGGGYTRLKAGYVTTVSGVYNEAYFSTATQQIGFELVRSGPGAAPIPYSGAFTNIGYFECEACLKFGEQCAFTGTNAQCTREFLAVSGTVSFQSATENVTSGQFAGVVSNVVLRQWNFTSDTQVANGLCYSLPGATFTASWP
jgi:hypothetical protein